MSTVKRGPKKAEGKTKKIFEAKGLPGKAIIFSKDDVTAGDGLRHDIVPGKGAWATTTTSNVFGLLKKCGLPVAFDGQISPNEFLADECEMLPYEVILRRDARGSFVQRNPHIKTGTIFPQLVFEIDLKTSGKKWGKHRLECDDPLMVIHYDTETVDLLNPHKIIAGQKPFLTLPFSEVFKFKNVREVLERIEYLARVQFLVLEKAWELLGRKLKDIKVEFGVTKFAWRSADYLDPMMVLIADVLDADSWRVLFKGTHESKEWYRQGGALDKLAEKYATAAEMSNRFNIPEQQIIVWTGSPDDDVSAFKQALDPFVTAGALSVKYVVNSMHKKPIAGLLALNQLLGEISDAVVIDYIGMSNGAGPTLSANVAVPVINVPAKIPDSTITFAHDAWSSLRLPSNVPAMTVLTPKNAVLAALQILAMRNPHLYALLRYEQELRFTNVVAIS